MELFGGKTDGQKKVRYAVIRATPGMNTACAIHPAPMPHTTRWR